jgi:hypothetical protein
MLSRIVSEWIESFSETRFRKPADWAKHLRPAATALWMAPATGPLDTAIQRA